MLLMSLFFNRDSFRIGERIALSGIGVLLAFAGASKLIDPASAARVISLTGVTAPWSDYAAFVAGPIELTLGLLLVLQVHTLLVLVAVGWLMVAFTVTLLRLLVLGDNAGCACFGEAVGRLLGDTPSAGILRNLVLLAIIGGAIISRLFFNRKDRATRILEVT